LIREIPHGKTLYGLSYPRRTVGGPMLACGYNEMKINEVVGETILDG
jgi:hypothetical protein